MTYNLTSINNTDLLSITQGVNTVLMEGQLGLLLLIGIGIILMSSLYWSTRGDWKASMTATMFILFLLSILLRAVSLVNTTVIFVTLVGTAISLAFT
jgi:hypothetical protein